MWHPVLALRCAPPWCRGVGCGLWWGTTVCAAWHLISLGTNESSNWTRSFASKSLTFVSRYRPVLLVESSTFPELLLNQTCSLAASLASGAYHLPCGMWVCTGAHPRHTTYHEAAAHIWGVIVLLREFGRFRPPGCPHLTPIYSTYIPLIFHLYSTFVIPHLNIPLYIPLV